MHRCTKLIRIALMLLIPLLLTACGGGAGETTTQTPTISTAPQSVAVTAGQAANFTVTAGGTGPFTYQWKRNGTNIAGATAASYSITASTADNGTQFAVVVSNAGGTVTSSAATLTVNAAVPVTINSSPTATFAASQTNASALIQEVQAAVPDLVAAASSQGLPGAINTLPGGVVSTVDCSALGGTGSISYSDNWGTAYTAGSSYTFTYNNCSISSGGMTITFNGTVTVTYSRFNSYTDFAANFSYSNFSYSSTGTYNYSYGPTSGSFTIDYANGVYSYTSTLSNGGQTNISGSYVVHSGNNTTITSATYVYNSSCAGGVVRVVFNNWSYSTATGYPVSGSITVTGANGNTVRIDATGTGYTVTYTINGVASSYSVSY